MPDQKIKHYSKTRFKKFSKRMEGKNALNGKTYSTTC